MEGMEDLFEVVQQLRDKIDGKERDERFGDFQAKHGSKWKDDRGIGLRVFNELEERGVDVSAADEVLQKMLGSIREESIAQKKVIEDLLDKIEAVSDSVSKVLNEEGKVAETATPMPALDPNAIPQSIPPGGPGAPMPDTTATNMGGASTDMGAPPPPVPGMDAGGGAPPPPSPTPDMMSPPPSPDMGGAPPPADPIPSDIKVKEELEPTPDEATEEVIKDEGIGKDEDDADTPTDDVPTDDGEDQSIVDALLDILGLNEGEGEGEIEMEESTPMDLGDGIEDDDDFEDEEDDELIPLSSLGKSDVSVDDLFDEDEVAEDTTEDDSVLNYLLRENG